MTCSACGFVHGSNWARAVDRFGGAPGYVAAGAPTPVRATRAEAEADECAWRAARRDEVRLTVAPSPAARVTPPEAPKPPPGPFPAARMETAARERAWLRFLAEIEFSLTVWQLDPDTHTEASPLAWLARCRDQLDAILAEARPC